MDIIDHKFHLGCQKGRINDASICKGVGLLCRVSEEQVHEGTAVSALQRRPVSGSLGGVCFTCVVLSLTLVLSPNFMEAVVQLASYSSLNR